MVMLKICTFLYVFKTGARSWKPDNAVSQNGREIEKFAAFVFDLWPYLFTTDWDLNKNIVYWFGEEA